MARGPDAGTLLQRALIDAAAREGCSIQVDAAEAQAWQSATFIGARHTLTVSTEASAHLSDWLGGIGDADLPLCGHLLADITVASVGTIRGRCRVIIEALTLDDS